MGPDRQCAPPAQLGQEGPLGARPPGARTVVVDGGQCRPGSPASSLPALHGQRALGHLGEHRPRVRASRRRSRQAATSPAGRAPPWPPPPRQPRRFPPWPAGWPGSPAGRRRRGRAGGWPSCARRRAEPVATCDPVGRSPSPPPTSTSRGSARSGNAASTSPGTRPARRRRAGPWPSAPRHRRRREHRGLDLLDEHALAAESGRAARRSGGPPRCRPPPATRPHPSRRAGRRPCGPATGPEASPGWPVGAPVGLAHGGHSRATG